MPTLTCPRCKWRWVVETREEAERPCCPSCGQRLKIRQPRTSTAEPAAGLDQKTEMIHPPAETGSMLNAPEQDTSITTSPTVPTATASPGFHLPCPACRAWVTVQPHQLAGWVQCASCQSSMYVPPAPASAVSPTPSAPAPNSVVAEPTPPASLATPPARLGILIGQSKVSAWAWALPSGAFVFFFVAVLVIIGFTAYLKGIHLPWLENVEQTRKRAYDTATEFTRQKGEFDRAMVQGNWARAEAAGDRAGKTLATYQGLLQALIKNEPEQSLRDDWIRRQEAAERDRKDLDRQMSNLAGRKLGLQ